MTSPSLQNPVFVAGATGYVGQALVRYFSNQGRTVVAHVRPDSAELEVWKARFGDLGAAVDTTPWEIGALADALKKLNPSVVFCLIGTTRERMKQLRNKGEDAQKASYEAVDYGLTAMLAGACAKAGIRPRFVYLSSIGSGPKASGAYLKARYKAEQVVQASGLPFTIARPAIITGPDREEKRLGERLAGRVMDCGVSCLGVLGLSSSAKRYASITAERLATALAHLGDEPSAEGRVVEREDLET